MVWHSTRRITLAALFAFSLLLVPSESMAQTVTRYCDCGPLSVAACTAGNDSTGNGSVATPYQTWGAAQALFNNEGSFAAGDTIAFCQGGHFNNAPTGRWVNFNCSVSTKCTVTDYVPSWNGESQMPISSQTTANGVVLTLATSLTTNNITSVTTVEACPGSAGGGGTDAIWVEDDNGWYRKLLFSGCASSVYTITQTNGYEDFAIVNATSGNGVSVNTTINDPQFVTMDGNGNQLNTTSGYVWSNLDIRGPLNWTQFNTEGGTGFFLFGDRDDITFDNIKLSGFGNGFLVRFNSEDPQFMERVNIINSEIFHNRGSGLLGGSRNATIDNNYMWENGDEQFLEHTVYISRTANGSTYSNNIIEDSNFGTGQDCNGASVIAHGVQSDITFSGNIIRQTRGNPPNSGCWGTGFDGGYSAAESFTNFVISGNTVSGFGRGITMGSAVNAIIENNVVIVETNNATALAIQIPNGNGGTGDAVSTGNTIRNNSILYVAGTTGSAIDLGSEGTGNSIVSNAINYLGTDSTFNCLTGSSVATPYTTVANNICRRGSSGTVGEWMDTVGSLTTWQAVGSGMGTSSVEGDPGFADVVAPVFDMSAASGSSTMVGIGHLTESAPNDFLGVARGSSPDSGAYQFGVPAAIVTLVPLWSGP